MARLRERKGQVPLPPQMMKKNHVIRPSVTGGKVKNQVIRPRIADTKTKMRRNRGMVGTAAAPRIFLLLALLVGLLAKTFPGFPFVEALSATADEGDGASVGINDLVRDDYYNNFTHDGEQRRLEGQSPVDLMASKRRDYLNDLVAASALETGDQVSNLVLFKTHKTASTTLATLLHRYGRRHNLEVAHFPGFGSTIPIAEAAEKTRENQKRLDIMHYHIDTDTPRQESWAKARELYKDVMRDPDNINFITIFREPRDRLLSFYTFFVEFDTRVPIEEFFRQENPDEKVLEQLRSLGCKEFGVETEAELDEFIEYEIPRFKLILLTERFDESLVVLRNVLGWHLIDVTYVSVNLTAGRQSAKGVLKERMPFDELPKYAQDKIDELTVLDRRLYDAGAAAFEKSRASVAEEVEIDLVDFENLQTVMNEYLVHNPRSPALAMYRYHTAEYYEHPPPMLDF